MSVKSPTKANTDLHNGDLQFVIFSFRDSACYHQVSSIMLNRHSINHLIVSLTLTLISASYCPSESRWRWFTSIRKTLDSN